MRDLEHKLPISQDLRPRLRTWAQQHCRYDGGERSIDMSDFHKLGLLLSSVWLIVLLLGLTYWPGTARLLRAQILTLRARDYVLAARALGVRVIKIVGTFATIALLWSLWTSPSVEAWVALLLRAWP